MNPKPALATVAAHAGVPGRAVEAPSPARPHVEPLYQTSVFEFASIDESVPALAGDGGYVYARHGLPNTDSFARAVAALEGAGAGVATSSGMSAIACVVMALCRAGDRVVVQRDAYGGTSAMFERDLRKLGVDFEYADAYDPDAVNARLEGAALLLVESISNPLLRAVSIEELARRAARRGATLVVNNTFATPVALRPLALGADLVLHSATKFLGGHHDLCAGVVVGGAELIDRVRGVALRTGMMASPFEAWLAVRGLRTLDVRMARACATAAELARRLAGHPAVRAVHAAERCALVSFDVGGRAEAERVVAGLGWIRLAPSLGGTTTTVAHPVTSSHRALSPEALAAAGIGPGLLRLSVGLEDAGDLWGALSAALDGLPPGVS